ncbi:MAG: hypothetical protein HON78_02435 [Legionellales bacterium]|nr:hypothetical protein [Legionellales bacterium]
MKAFSVLLTTGLICDDAKPEALLETAFSVISQETKTDRQTIDTNTLTFLIINSL